MLYRSPRLYDLAQSRWTLAGLREKVEWMHELSLGAISKTLRRWDIRYRRGRQSLHSPDLAYNAKVAAVEQALQQCRQTPTRCKFVYVDEHTMHRNPTNASALAQMGTDADPQVRPLYAGYNCGRRFAGALNPVTGELITQQRNHFPADAFLDFLLSIEAQYPDAEVIYVAMDNWPVHFAPTVLEGLAQRHSRLQLLRLPTYAPWTNPIEKVWLKFNREVTHLHPLSYKWKELRQIADDWLAALRPGSDALLHEVGLLPDFCPPATACSRKSKRAAKDNGT